MELPRELLRMIPYKAGKPIEETKREFGLTEVYKLASNENPFGPSPFGLRAVQEKLSNIALYCDPSFHELLSACEKHYKLDRKSISVGNGSNESIDLLIRIMTKPGGKILTTKYAFVAYQVCAEASRVQTVFAAVDDRMGASLSAMDEQLRLDHDRKIKIVFIPNPNNPTGSLLPSSELEGFIRNWEKRDDLLIVIDEAYFEYVREKSHRSFIPDVPRFKNLAVLRTFSKTYGLAALRVGLIFASADLIDVYNRVRIPFNVNELGQAAAAASLDDHEHVKKTVEHTWRELDWVSGELECFDLPYLRSHGNFILFETKRDASQVYVELLKRGIILRPTANY